MRVVNFLLYLQKLTFLLKSLCFFLINRTFVHDYVFNRFLICLMGFYNGSRCYFAAFGVTVYLEIYKVSRVHWSCSKNRCNNTLVTRRYLHSRIDVRGFFTTFDLILCCKSWPRFWRGLILVSCWFNNPMNWLMSLLAHQDVNF